jgi:hypothetical protein
MLIQERRSTLYFIIIKTSYGGESLRFYDREETTLSLSLSSNQKREIKGNKMAVKRTDLYMYIIYMPVSIYSEEQGMYTIIFLYLFSFSFFSIFECRRTKNINIRQQNTAAAAAVAHIFWIVNVSVRFDCYSHYINPIFCGQRVFLLSLYYYCYYYVLLNNNDRLEGSGESWQQTFATITTLLMIDIAI